VDRNRLKRRLRELARVELLPVVRSSAAVDIAIRARRDAYAAAFDALRVDVRTVADQSTTAVGAPRETKE
jgi:ribonuclease P protein component